MGIDWNKLHPLLDDGDWSAAFGEPEGYGSSTRPGPFARADVAEVLMLRAQSGYPPSESERDYGEVMLWAVFRLADGRFGYLEAGCDTTGWGCQDSNAWAIADSRDALWPLIGDEGRERLGKPSALQHPDLRVDGR